MTYDGLPIAAGGAHTLRSRGFREAWTQIEHFLRRCSDFDRPQQIVIEVIEGGGAPAAFVTPLKRQFSRQFTKVRSRRIGAAVGHQWSADGADLVALLGEMEAVRPIPDVEFAPLTLNVTAAFRFVDPWTRELLPFQNPADYLRQDAGNRHLLGASSAFARLSTRSTLSAFFSLPFPESSAECLAYVEFLREHAPVQLSDRHWTAWTLNMRGTRYTGRRLAFGPPGAPRLTRGPRPAG